MGVHAKAYPIRYSLDSSESKKISQKLKAKGGATRSEIRRLASHHRVAQKTVAEMLNRLGLPIKPDYVPPKKKDAHTAAEAFFKDPEPEEPKQLSFDELAELERSIRSEQEETLQSLSDMEKEMNEALAESARQRERAETAIQKTKQLRKSTIEDRKRIDELEGEMHAAQRKARAAQKERDEAVQAANDVTADMRDLMEYTERLRKALEQSEADLAQCRSGYPSRVD